MMLDMQVEYCGSAGDPRNSENGLISLVGITGEWSGSGIFCCSPTLASLISSRMLGTTPEPEKSVVDEQVLDVVAEVTNMMIGNIKNALEEITGPMAISVPTVVHGRNFRFRSALGLRGAALTFSAEGERFEVRIALAPESEHAASRSRVPVLGLAHI
jgi:chemotaxis protein CheX